MEIERKFLLSRLPDGFDAHPARRLEQGYLAIGADGVETRVRNDDGRYVLTVKSGPGMARVEEELDIDAERFARLWALTDGRRVVKTRALVPVGDGLTAEVDVYAGRLDGLLTAEVEFADEAAARAFAPPAWMGREVTGDASYANQALATRGRPG